MRRAVFALAAVFALQGAAFAAGEQCQEPYGPVLPDSARATKADLRAVKAEVEAFIRDSDAYQACLLHVIDMGRKAKKDRGLSDSQIAALQRRVSSNQREKEAIGHGYNELVRIVNARGG